MVISGGIWLAEVPAEGPSPSWVAGGCKGRAKEEDILTLDLE